MIRQVAEVLSAIRFEQSDIAIFLGEYLSEPKATVFFDPPEKPLSRSAFVQRATKRGLRLSRRTRMLYTGKYVFINGESFQVSRADQGILRRLADDRQIVANELQGASDDVEAAFHQWYMDGWLCI